MSGCKIRGRGRVRRQDSKVRAIPRAACRVEIRARGIVGSAWFSVEEGPGLGYGCDLVAVTIRVM